MTDDNLTAVGDWTAYYAPALSSGKENPSRSGFKTEDEALEYIYSQMCVECKKSLEAFRRGEIESDDVYTPCDAEFFIVPTDALDKAEDLGDIMRAAGYTEYAP